MRKVFIIIVLPVLFSYSAFSQQSADLGVLGGAGYYVGDLNPGHPFRMPKPAFGLLYRYNINTRVAVRAHGIYGKVAGDDAVSEANTARNLNFESKIYEGGFQVEVNFFDYFVGSEKNRITPYIFGGINIFFFEPFGMVDDTLVALQPLKTEGQGRDFRPVPYKLHAISYPLGLGVKYNLTKQIAVGAEWGMRKTTTDYLDDVSTTYYLNQGDPGFVLPDGITSQMAKASDPFQTHNEGMQRGNSRDTDWYSFAMVSVTVKFESLLTSFNKYYWILHNRKRKA